MGLCIAETKSMNSTEANSQGWVEKESLTSARHLQVWNYPTEVDWCVKQMHANKKIKEQTLRAGEAVHWIKILTAQPGELDLILSTHIVTTVACNSNSRGFNTFSILTSLGSRPPRATQIYMQAKHMHTQNKIQFFKNLKRKLCLPLHQVSSSQLGVLSTQP